MDSSSFDVVAGPDARILILGSLPGAVSLARQEYYAQPRNAFWPIMAELAGASPILPYAERLKVLVESGFALWDVCARATRKGSLDTAIQMSTVIPNDIPGFLLSHTRITLIAFNGAKSAELFRRLLLPQLATAASPIPTATLPSTSPAHASLTFQQKLHAWRSALGASLIYRA